jgi:hypothetical protein
VVGSHKCGEEPSGSGITELARVLQTIPLYLTQHQSAENNSKHLRILSKKEKCTTINTKARVNSEHREQRTDDRNSSRF